MRAKPPARYFLKVRYLEAGAIVIFSLLLWGCSTGLLRVPTDVTVTPIESSGHAAKDPSCKMPVLRGDPLRDYRKVAIIEGLGNIYGKENDVLPQVVAKACGTGADAIIVQTSKSQSSEHMIGYYVNAVAIVYVNNDQTYRASSTDEKQSAIPAAK